MDGNALFNYLPKDVQVWFGKTALPSSLVSNACAVAGWTRWEMTDFLLASPGGYASHGESKSAALTIPLPLLLYHYVSLSNILPFSFGQAMMRPYLES